MKTCRCIMVFVMVFVACVSYSEADSRQEGLPDTGQTVCYDEGGNAIDCSTDGYVGQDANYEGTQMSFQDNGDGTVTDLNTGLVWQKTPDYTRYGFDEAKTYVESLEIGGYTDWRLPTIKELYSSTG